LIDQPVLTDVPTAHDALSARVAEEVGFDAVLLGDGMGANFSAALPDIGLITTTEIIDHLRRVAAGTAISVIADLGDGGGNALRVRRAVRLAEQAGAAAVMIEDIESTDTKHVDLLQQGRLDFSKETLWSFDRAVANIKSAVDARQDPNTVIIARTDSYPVAGLDEASKRARAFHAAGADLISITSAPTESLKTIAGPATTMHFMHSFRVTPNAEQRAELVSVGVRLGLYGGRVQAAAYASIRHELELIRSGLVDQPFDVDTYIRTLGIGIADYL
jgi:2-methylisocitrate lyase-like PEP mutase family enzyme